LFVEVALNLPIDTTFIYRVSGKESYSPEIGKRVIVPFGKGDKLKTGIIISVLKKIETVDFEIKEVFDIPDPYPILTQTTLDLSRWVSEFYCSSFGETLFRFLPEGFVIEEKIKVKLLKNEKDERLSPNELKLVNLLESSASGILSISTIKRKLSISNSVEVVKRLANKGIVEIVNQVKADAINRVPYLVYREGNYNGKGEKIRELFEILVREKKIALRGVKKLGFSNQTINSLLEKGIAEIVYKRELVSFKPQELTERKNIVLTPSQRRALNGILSSGGPHLLFGVAGSGKMEVYLQAAKRVIENGKRVLILVPELLLTPELRSRIEDYFGKVAIFHGKLSRKEKVSSWLSALKGEYQVFLGTRQAVMLPIKDLGLIVVDEEQDSSYKEQQKPYYNAREVAIKRGEIENIPVVLVSATPSVETYKRALEGRFRLHRLKERVTGLPLPKIEIVDLSKEKRRGLLSEKLLKTLESVVSSGKQALLYISRRGYYSKVFCPNCGFLAECKDCCVPLTYHKTQKLFICHICGKRYRPVYRCPKCGTLLEFRGYGTERVEDELKLLYPEWKIVRLDLDTVKDPIKGAKLIKEIKEGKWNVIVGTNIAIKGHNFPKLSFVCVLLADLLGGPPDFKNSERIFQTIIQATGRAGRFTAGSAMVQTLNPSLPSVINAANYKYEDFYRDELLSREILGYPPFKLGILLEFLIKKREHLKELKEAYEELKVRLSPEFEFPKLNPAPIPKVSGSFRYIAFLKTNWENALDKIEKLKTEVSKLPRKITCKIDVEPTKVS
jgi:primosomal protein N' (replication factor Y)